MGKDQAPRLSGSVIPGGAALKDPRLLSFDPSSPPWVRDRRVDLTASNVKTISGKYVVFEYRVPEKSILAVKAVVPYAMQRIQVGALDESFQLISSKDGYGWFAFEPKVNDGAAWNVELDYNAPQLVNGALNVNPNDNLRQRDAAITYIADEPGRDLFLQWQNPLYSFLVPGTAVLRVLFQVLPPPGTNPLGVTGRFTIGNTTTPSEQPTKRVDFAGVIIAGSQMSEQHYKNLIHRVQSGMP